MYYILKKYDKIVKTKGGKLMKNYIITTDNNADLPDEYYKEHNIDIVLFSYMIDDVIYDGVENSLSIEEFYEKVRNGAMPCTQQVNPENSRIFLEKYVRKGMPVIHLSFSSGLSGTYNSVCMGANEIKEAYPDAKITVIDTLCASMGQGLLVHEVLKRQRAGMSYEELVEWIENNKLRIVHDVIADDLFHLHRGGRVSKFAAVVGTKLGVKPIIHLNSEGKLIPYSKQRHKSSAMRYLANNLDRRIKVEDNLSTVAISHSACLEDAKKLATIIEKDPRVGEIIISDIGPTIGSHTGTGTIALFYFADNRNI